MDKDSQAILSMINEAPNIIFFAHRKASFETGKWIFDKDKKAVCTGEKLAEAGFHNTSTRADPSAATCAFCLKEMLFDSTDDPWEEHKKHCPSCYFVGFNKRDENKLTVEEFFRLIAYRKSGLLGEQMDKMISDFSRAAKYVTETMKLPS